MEVVVCIFVMVFVITLGRYILAEGQRIESQKKFMKNMNDFDKKNKK
jgi:hypothetical protein|tara:strand:- start:1040 stop:1180 length:141 start_codon:yes stop_codon:yes gene_type:complete